MQGAISANGTHRATFPATVDRRGDRGPGRVPVQFALRPDATEERTTVALVLYVVGLLVLFGVRTWLHVRRTGTSGFSGISGPPGSLRWWAGVLFLLALLLGVLAPALAVTGSVPAPELPPAVAVAGLVLALTGFLGVLAAQTGMGASWRIGVRETERTDLVTGGLFAVVRNPIFTLMVLAQSGFALMVPTAPSLAALGCLVAAVELQVRLIEEP